MPRRNEGPRLKWHRYGAAYYICWTENGRSRERSTSTADREQAEIVFAEWLQVRGRKTGPGDPAKVLVTDTLTDYANERGPKVAAPRVIGCAISAMTPYWAGLTVAQITPLTCGKYVDWRGRSANTARRELAVLQSAINWGYKNGNLTRSVAVTLPAMPESRKRWLTREEAANLIRAARTEKARLYLPLFILIGLYTGRRKEAILSLRWPQVDLERGLIDFEIPGRQRTKKQRGAVPIPRKLLPHWKRQGCAALNWVTCCISTALPSETLRRASLPRANVLASRTRRLTLSGTRQQRGGCNQALGHGRLQAFWR
jgi:integrase